MNGCLEEGVLQSFFDGELVHEEMSAVVRHLSACAACSLEAREMESEIALMSAALSCETALPVPTNRLRERLYTAIAETPVKTAPASGLVRVWENLKAAFASLSLTPQRAVGFASLTVVAILALAFYAALPFPSTEGNIADLVAPVPHSHVAPVEIKDGEPRRIAEQAVKVVSYPLREESGTVKRKARARSSAAEGYHAAGLAAVHLLPGEKSYLKTIVALKSKIEADGDAALSPDLRVEYERSLNVVDEAISSTRAAALTNPNDADAASSLLLAYQSKVDLLSAVVNRSQSSGDR